MTPLREVTWEVMAEGGVEVKDMPRGATGPVAAQPFADGVTGTPQRAHGSLDVMSSGIGHDALAELVTISAHAIESEARPVHTGQTYSAAPSEATSRGGSEGAHSNQTHHLQLHHRGDTISLSFPVCSGFSLVLRQLDTTMCWQLGSTATAWHVDIAQDMV